MKYSASLLVAAGLAAAQSSSVTTTAFSSVTTSASTSASSSSHSSIPGEVVSVFLPAFDTDALVASVISAGPTATSYKVGCPTGGADSDECGLGGGLDVLYGPSTMTYAMTLADTETFTYSANCKLDPAANTANCNGAVISGASTSTGVEVLTGYSSFIMPVTITAGAEKLAAATRTSTGGMPRITQNAVVMGGAAALVGGAAMFL